MTKPNIPIHPDDVLFFNEVVGVMQKVAKQYDLPLRQVVGASMPAEGMSDFKGRCSSDGTIELVMRCTVDGQFVAEPRSPQAVWDTAAHELAHLRHANHGVKFNEFWQELREAIDNLQVDHRQKTIDKLLKMQKSRDGEAALGNNDAAEAFAAAINKMMLEHELEPSDLDYAHAMQDDPVVEVKTDLKKYRVEQKQSRIAWQETLARIVANAHLCKFLVRSRSNDIWFVGTRSHATVAEYVYGILVRNANVMSWKAYRAYLEEGIEAYGKAKAVKAGFRSSWQMAFVERVAERLKEARTAAVADVPMEHRGTALMRLEGALVKAQQYVDDKFKARRGLPALAYSRASNAEGARQGRAAADAMPIGRRGVTGGTKGLLGN